MQNDQGNCRKVFKQVLAKDSLKNGFICWGDCWGNRWAVAGGTMGSGNHRRFFKMLYKNPSRQSLVREKSTKNL